MKLLSKAIDRLLFHLIFRHRYKRDFKFYGDNIRWGRDFTKLCIPKSVRVSCPGLISIGDNCSFDEGTYLQCHEQGGGIEIGSGTRLNAHTHVQAYSKIVIGKKVLAAPFCMLNSGVHGVGSESEAIMHQEYLPSGEITIGSGSWLGRTVQVTGGVSLGTNVTAGAGAVVTKSFPDGALIGGVPAKALRS